MQATPRMLEAHANVKALSLVDAKLKFIQAWQSLPEYGVTLFVIKFDGHKKEELLGVAPNRIMRMDVNNGDHLKIWRYNTMKVCAQFSFCFLNLEIDFIEEKSE